MTDEGVSKLWQMKVFANCDRWGLWLTHVVEIMTGEGGCKLWLIRNLASLPLSLLIKRLSTWSLKIYDRWSCLQLWQMMVVANYDRWRWFQIVTDEGYDRWMWLQIMTIEGSWKLWQMKVMTDEGACKLWQMRAMTDEGYDKRGYDRFRKSRYSYDRLR